MDYLQKRLRVYEGKNLLEQTADKTEPIIQDFLYENDYVLLVAKEKIGKSVFAMQMACCLSSGTPLLDVLEVPRPVRVWYISLEGKDHDMKDRLIRMAPKINLNVNNFKLICCAGMLLNMKSGQALMEQLLSKYANELPKVIIIDPLYMALKGSIKDDSVVNDFTQVVRGFAERSDASIVVVHHSRRAIRTQDGRVIDSGDDEIFGSAFLKASVDHVFYMGNVEGDKMTKFLRCDTQRSGNIVEDIVMKLNEPNPLWFEHTSISSNVQLKVKVALSSSKDGLSVSDIVKKAEVSRVSVYSAIKSMGDDVERISGRPVVYKLKG